MEKSPLTLEDATDIAEDFEDLIDTDVIEKDGITYTVTHVVVSPFNEADKNSFAQTCINQSADNANELLREYNTSDYDVIIISQNTDAETNNEFHVIDIRTFIQENGINYRLPSAH